MKVRITVASLVSVVGCLVLTWAALVLAGRRTSEPEPLTFHYHLAIMPQTLDPARAELRFSFGVIDRLFDGLMRLDRVRGVPETELAASYDVSDDDRMYEFQLLPDARFHSGRVVRASDFKLTWERLLAPGTMSPKAWLLEMVVGADAYRRGAADSVDGIEVVDSNTLRVHLKRPFAPFLYHLAHPATSVIPEEEVGKLGEDFGRRPVGSGPYRFDSRPDESTLVLKAFAGHPRHSPRVRTLVYEIESNVDEALRRYQIGQLDLVTRLPTANLPALRKSFPRDLRVFPETSWAGFCFRCDRGPFRDRRVRRALALALDREALVHKTSTEVRTAAVGFLPPAVPGHDPATLAPGFDPEQAAELLAAAGYPNGAGFPPLVFTGVLPTTERFLTEAFSRLGIETRFEPTEGSEYFLKAWDEGRLHVFPNIEIGDYPDPEPYLGPRFHSQGRSNRMGYDEPEVDRLLEEARSERDPAERLKLYRRAERRIIDDAPCVVLYQLNGAVLLQPRWKGIPLGYNRYLFEIERAQPVEEGR